MAVTNYTITPTLALTDGLVFRIELRQDIANKKIYVDDKGTAEDSATSAGAQLVLSF